MCHLGDKWSSGWKVSSCSLVKPVSRETTVSRWGYMKGLQKSCRACFRSPVTSPIDACCCCYWHSFVFQQLLLTVTLQVYLGWKTRQVIRTACQLLTCREGQRQCAGGSVKPLFFFFLPLYFLEHFKHLWGITVCLSWALRQRFWERKFSLLWDMKRH